MNIEHHPDRIYAHPRNEIADFVFDATVARVFSDMINRSVPGYRTVVSMTGLLAQRFAQADSVCYDLGCSLGATTLAMRRFIKQRDCWIVAVDKSPAMAERCRENIKADDTAMPVEVVCADIRDIKIQRASVVVLNYTLQFIDQPQRMDLLKAIHDGLRPGGALILSEKIAFEDPDTHARFTQMHHDFKKANGYSELEISQKRTALEQVLVPDTLTQHQARLKDAGFGTSELWFQCLNFASLLAIK